MKLEYCNAFLPRKKLKITETQGKWCRLWHSYAPGLFVYYQFLAPIRTNMELKRLFGKEKQAIFNRVAKANVCRIVATKGEDYLRILHCSPEELHSDIIKEYSEEIVKELRKELATNIKAMSEISHLRSMEHENFNLDIIKQLKKNRARLLLSTKTNLLPHKKK